jgi:hypothetical protein
VTNDTYINQWVFGEFLDKIAEAYAGTPLLWCWTTPDTKNASLLPTRPKI